MYFLLFVSWFYRIYRLLDVNFAGAFVSMHCERVSFGNGKLPAQLHSCGVKAGSIDFSGVKSIPVTHRVI